MHYTKKKLKTIGVLGGMGAAASADFYRQLVEIAQKDYQAEADDDFPPMWIYNLPVRDFDETGFADPESVKEQLVTTSSLFRLNVYELAASARSQDKIRRRNEDMTEEQRHKLTLSLCKAVRFLMQQKSEMLVYEPGPEDG